METKSQTPKLILNPDHDLVSKITARINKCHGCCPCQPITPDTDTRCPCADFYNGICHCSLFIPAE